MNGSELLEVGRLLLEVAIIPLVKILFDLNRTISDLKITLHRDFVSWERFNEHNRETAPRRYRGKENAQD